MGGIRVLFDSHNDAWRYLHYYAEHMPVTAAEWDKAVGDYSREACRCFKNGVNADAGYAEGYDEGLAAYRLGIFRQAFEWLMARKG